MTRSGLEAASDGVLAIAITLLVIGLPRGPCRPAAHALWQQWSSDVAYLVSFLTTG